MPEKKQKPTPTEKPNQSEMTTEQIIELMTQTTNEIEELKEQLSTVMADNKKLTKNSTELINTIVSMKDEKTKEEVKKERAKKTLDDIIKKVIKGEKING